MGDGFVYGRCERFNSIISTEFCRRYKNGRGEGWGKYDRGNDGCANCGGLNMDLTPDKIPVPRAEMPAETAAAPTGLTDQKGPAVEGGREEPLAAKAAEEKRLEAPKHKALFAEAFKAAKAKSGKTLKEIGRATGTHISSVCAWSSGRIPSVQNLQRLDELLGSDLCARFGGDAPAGQPPKPVLAAVDDSVEALHQDLIRAAKNEHPLYTVEFTTFAERTLDVLNKLTDCLTVILKRGAEWEWKE